MLLLLSIILKLGYWSMPQAILLEQNMVLYNSIWYTMQKFLGFSTFTWSIIGVLSVFGQSLYINNIANRFDLFTNMTYLPAFTYIALSSIIPSWNVVGPYMVLTWFMLGILDNALRLYQVNQNRFVIVNLGVLIGFSALLLPELVVLALFGIIAISVFRAFNFGDWLAYILGLITPLYILFALLYFKGKLSLLTAIFDFDLALITQINSPLKLTIAITIIVISLIMGAVYLMQFMSRMVMEHQKYWTVVIVFLITCAIAAVLTLRNDWANWIIVLPTLALIVNNAWLSTRKKWIATTLSYLLIVCSLYIQWL